MRTLLLSLAGLIIVVGVVYFVWPALPTPKPAPAAQTQAPALPPVTEHMQAVLDASHGFAAFISYANGGFQPHSTSLKVGDSVRFTNNSDHDLHITATAGGGAMYPKISGTCGQSDFDSCVTMPPHDIWEFTFTKAGDWTYDNALMPADSGVIHVQ